MMLSFKFTAQFAAEYFTYFNESGIAINEVYLHYKGMIPTVVTS